jgi:imidazolonepropionase-like amidohydrolase
MRTRGLPVVVGLVLALVAQFSRGDVAIYGEIVHTVAGDPITNGVVLVKGTKIAAVGRLENVAIPAGTPELRARVVTPGLVDAHSTIGVSGFLNQNHDQEQLEKSAPMQPELRAIDAYNPRDELVDYVRSLGVTTVHTGHAPGALISGQTMVVKTFPPSLEQAVLQPSAMLAASLGDAALSDKPDKPPGTRAKAVALLRAELIKASEYARKMGLPEADKRPARDLHFEMLAKLLDRSMPLLVTVHRHQDILSALRLAAEFNLRLVLDGAGDAMLVAEEIRGSGFPVIVHPTMIRAVSSGRERESGDCGEVA